MRHNYVAVNGDSEDDTKLTKRLAEAGEIVGIDVLDHIIIGDKNYLSLKREGLFWDTPNFYPMGVGLPFYIFTKGVKNRFYAFSGLLQSCSTTPISSLPI